MKLLVLFLILLAALAFVQIERNDCYWLASTMPCAGRPA